MCGYLSMLMSSMGYVGISVGIKGLTGRTEGRGEKVTTVGVVWTMRSVGEILKSGGFSRHSAGKFLDI
jgi:hypothetical protein